MRTEIMGRQEILGHDEILEDFVGRQEILGHGPDFDDVFGLEEILGCDRSAGTFVGHQEILDTFVGRDERDLARDGSHADRSALRRLSSRAEPGSFAARAASREGLGTLPGFPSLSSGLEEIIGREGRARRRARRQRRIQDLKTRAASGDQQAIARLRKMQADLGVPVTTTPATYPAYSAPAAIPQYGITPASTTPAAIPQYGITPASTAAPAYSPYYQQPYTYQNPYYDPSLQPPVDVYLGDCLGRQEILGSFVGDEERELARDGSRADRAALRRASSSGYNSHWKYSRTAGAEAELLEELQTRAAAGDLRAQRALAKIKQRVSENPTVKGECRLQTAKSSGDASSSQVDRQAAKQVLQAAAGSKKITRADLRRAIWLYAGKQSTVEERTAIGSKMIAYLNNNKVQLV
jgi:hypothetical protein